MQWAGAGPNWCCRTHNTGFLAGDTWLRMNLNKDITRFFCFLFLLPTSPFHAGGACYIKRGGKKMLGCAAKVTRQDQLWLPRGFPQGVRYKKQGLVYGFAFPRKRRACFSHPKSSLGIEFGSFWKEDLVSAMSLLPLPHVQDPAPLG